MKYIKTFNMYKINESYDNTEFIKLKEYLLKLTSIKDIKKYDNTISIKVTGEDFINKLENLLLFYNKTNPISHEIEIIAIKPNKNYPGAMSHVNDPDETVISTKKLKF